METIRTPLTKKQIIRLESFAELEGQPLSVVLVEIKGTSLKKIEVIYEDEHKQEIYLSEEDLDIVMNGITLTRDSR